MYVARGRFSLFFTKNKNKKHVVLEYLRFDPEWTLYLDPTGNNFPLAGRVMLSFLHAMPRKTGPNWRVFHTGSQCLLSLLAKKWFRIIYSATVGVDGWCSLCACCYFPSDGWTSFIKETKAVVAQVMKRWHFYRDCCSLAWWKTCLEI